ncbi:hypothetical protein OIU83_21910 [Flavobacterium sp. LS1R49]|uniref:Uncharacterized protein n=1 Tax=Flavobacterium shii TaxID=2987687 RepID=A0A9X2ZJ13_9FLAO|nr:hypothetical protein [Flavobacterium shii]MCV9930330.1 hypothetical protein [Flavobacterium shii]
MSTTNSNIQDCEPQIMPPGAIILLNSRNPEIGKVTFPERKSKGLLPPFVEAYYNKEDDSLSVNAIVYVDLDRKENESFAYSVYQNCYVDVNGNPQLQFFIAYNMLEQDATTFSIHELKFKVNKDIFIGKLADVKTIQTFLWDTDPIASRGTETNVQPG